MSLTPFTKRYFMFDYARQRSFVRGEFLLCLDALSRLGYNGVGLYLEGAFDFSSIPGVIREGVMTRDDAKWAVEEGKKRGILVFPMTNVVGHMEHFFRQERYRDLLMENTNDRQMNFFDERAEEFAMRIVHEFSDAFGSGIVHVGGDETTLKPEEKIPYAKFLAKICKNLLDEGITPAIWDDMIYADQPLCEYFDRRIAIFDWCYYGHRPESPKFFKEQGFTDVLACPCDNSWEGLICYQHVTGWLQSSKDIPVKPNEVEALFEDGRNAGVLSGMLTNWENSLGRNLWGQWTAFARGGLYMNGRIEAREENDELIEEVLFGRKTPYSEVTRLLQDKLPYAEEISYNKSYFAMRKALFVPASLIDLYNYLEEDKSFSIDMRAVANEAKELLDTWVTEGDFELLCKNAHYAICDMIIAADALCRALKRREDYTRAALLQFENKDSAYEILTSIEDDFKSAIDYIKAYSVTLERAIMKTGHTRTDLILLGRTCDRLEIIANAINDAKMGVGLIPIPRFERILNLAAKGEYIIT